MGFGELWVSLASPERVYIYLVRAIGFHKDNPT
jgi:hypothetical protein